MLQSTHAVGTIREAHRFHLQNFASFLMNIEGPWKSLRNAVFVPALALGVSPIFLALAVLLFIPYCRLLALACGALPLFVNPAATTWIQWLKMLTSRCLC